MVNEYRLHIVLAIDMLLCGIWWIYKTITKSQQKLDYSLDIILCGLSFISCGINIGYLLYGGN